MSKSFIPSPITPADVLGGALTQAEAAEQALRSTANVARMTLPAEHDVMRKLAKAIKEVQAIRERMRQVRESVRKIGGGL